VDEHTVSLERALDETRTGDIWLFRGTSRPDRAIQSMTNSPINHVGMTVAMDDMPALMWHAELGNKLVDVWTGTHQRGVQLNDAKEAVEQWINKYGQQCWLRQLIPDATREQANKALRVIARMDGTPFPSTMRLTARWFRGRVPVASELARGIPVLDKRFREAAERRKARQRQARLETAYCAETVAITYEEMGLLSTQKHANWFDPGSFWSGDELPLTRGYRLGDEIAVIPG
jgi:hypothetical protein